MFAGLSYCYQASQYEYFSNDLSSWCKAGAATASSGTKRESKNVYAPDRPLPSDDHGNPIPDTDAPHTQLGTRTSKKRGERYPQAREFGAHGKPVQTIDFTDHDKPLIHPNPHAHPAKPNPTGGTPQRGDPMPLENWKY